MFLKKVKGGSKKSPRWYLQLAVSERGPKGPRHRTLCTLGRYEELVNSGELKRLAEKITKFTEDAVLIDLEREDIKAAKLLGSVLVVEKAFKELGLDVKLREISRERKIQFDLGKAVKLMLINRILDPCSKLSVVRWKEVLYNSDEYRDVEAQHLYRAMDVVLEERERLKDQVYNAQISLFKPSLDVVFYDLTTIYFESEAEDELRRFGFSKDKRNDCIQVVLGVVISEEGLPIDYEVFSGDTFEGKTVLGMVERLKKRFEVERVILVGDRGLVSESLLSSLEDMGCGYVIAARIKGLSDKVKDKIAKEAGWENITEDLSVKELKVKGRRLIVYRSEKLREYERQKRSALFEWLKKQVLENPKRLMSSKKYSKYLKIEKAEIKLNLEVIRKEEIIEGVFGFWCSKNSVPKEEAYKVYKKLWQIEDVFRSTKSHLKIRPVYHYKPERIKAHILICYLAFCVMRTLEKRLKEAGIEMSLRDALHELGKVASVEIETVKGLIKARTRVEGITYKLFRALHVKIPPAILNQNHIQK